MLHKPEQTLAAGDRAPNFILPDQTGKFTMFYDEVRGRPFVLLFSGGSRPPALPPAVAAFDAAVADLDAAGVDVFGICQVPPEAVTSAAPKMRLWADPERKISEAFLAQLGFGGAAAVVQGEAVAILLDANQRILTVLRGAPGGLVQQARDFFTARPPAPAPRVCRANAPVLLMPDLLDRQMCTDLIAMFEQGKVEEGTVGSVLDGKEVTRIHHARKKRLDYRIEDMAIHGILQNVIGRRIAPELVKAFNFQGFRFDRFLVCRYAADREDRFHMHRDNVSPETAERRFAMTLNLNGDEYEGGELVFPEYGPDRYKPGNGGAVIFSCSLLHEALPVTKGVRFALLTFLRAPLPRPVPQAGAQPGGPARRA